jgi:general secretion pathway protein M
VNRTVFADSPCVGPLLVTLGVVVLVFAAVVWPWLEQNWEYDEEIANRVHQLGRFQALAATRPELERQLEQLRLESRNAAFYLKADTPALAGAELQNQVKQVVEAQGGKLTSTQILKVADEEGATRVSIRVRMTGDTETLLNVLYGLENGQPLLFLDNLSVRARRVSTRRSRRAKTVQRDPLDINFDLSGYLSQGAA